MCAVAYVLLRQQVERSAHTNAIVAAIAASNGNDVEVRSPAQVLEDFDLELARPPEVEEDTDELALRRVLGVGLGR